MIEGVLLIVRNCPFGVAPRTPILHSASLSPFANGAPYRYQYPAYLTQEIAHHPLSRLHDSVRGPGLSLPRSNCGLNVHKRALSPKENLISGSDSSD